MSFTLPELPYAYDALAPHMSAETLEFHHDKHHNAYLTVMNELIAGTDYASLSIEEIVKRSFTDNPKLFNQAAQYYNHVHFWNWMSPNGGGSVPGALNAKIDEDLGSMEKLRAAFIDAGKTQFGSGWAWLAVNDGALEVAARPNQDSPIMDGMTPILGVDVWEHAYYLRYQNRRPDYLAAWWNLVDWSAVAGRLANAG